jgi:hypothetical protein
MTHTRNNFWRTILALAVCVLCGGSFATVTYAATIEVEFAATPLFLDANVVPGDSTARTVTIRNVGTTDVDLFMSVQNTFNTGLADVMELAVTSGSDTYFTGSFSEFFTAAPHVLSPLPVGDERTYTFTASLDTTTGNAYQLTQFGFDLVIGVPGGPTFTDTPTGGGGGGGGQSRFSLFNESVDDTAAGLGRVTITWNTSDDATSYLVCGDLATADSFVLDPGAPRFGYQFVVPENTTRVISHSVDLTGLSPSTYECRPASRRSLSDAFSVGIPLRFTIPAGEVLGAATAAPVIAAQTMTPRTWPGTGSVLGASSKGTFGGPTYDEWRAELEAERAARASSTATTTEAISTSTSPVAMLEAATDTVADALGVAEPTMVRRYGLIGLAGLLLLGLLWYLRRPQY